MKNKQSLLWVVWDSNKSWNMIVRKYWSGFNLCWCHGQRLEHDYYTAKNATDLIKVVDCTGLMQFANKCLMQFAIKPVDFIELNIRLAAT